MFKLFLGLIMVLNFLVLDEASCCKVEEVRPLESGFVRTKTLLLLVDEVAFSFDVDGSYLVLKTMA